ncbi:hypothetical protein I7X12_02525 [Halosimplex litoreum]|uniref:DUF8009 domain-containing protein n=1 Tax=Halosimplex litoreum TaxID=1198301 RepID=A0A7T3FZC8_9EURY|nr:hypothetical protein [Halosimplex litoreum]QPV63528.1 hypothetical protein I7X12_02525 [Halosimplex litoreum]
MDGASDDPRRIRTLAVTGEDVIAALEARAQRDQPVVLRATPPFSGRMRARLHVGTGEYDESPAPLHVDPGTLLDDAAPTYPRPAETEDELRAEPDTEYTVERHRDRHENAVAAWRESVLDHVRDTAPVETPRGPHEVGVSLLG